MKIFLYVLFFFYSAFANTSSFYVPDVKKFIEDSDIGAITKNHQIPTTALPGLVFYAKNTKPHPDYPDGIHQFLISGSQKATYHFNSVGFLKGKKALLHIIVNEDVKNPTIALPEIDTVIDGKQMDGSIIFLGSSTTINNAHYYFFTNIISSEQKIQLKARGHVYAEEPGVFSILPDSSTNKIIPLKHVDSSLSHTINQPVKPQNKTAVSESRQDRHHHVRPARAHQKRQIDEYNKASQEGHKHLTLEAATGSGKTDTMLRIAESVRPKKILIVTPRLNLVEQIKNEARLYYPNLSIADDSDGNQNFKQLVSQNKDKDVSVVTLQGFQLNYKDETVLNNFDVIIFDEAHNLLSVERASMVEHLKKHRQGRLQILFFTATPTRLFEHKKSKLKSVFQLSSEPLSSPQITPFPIKPAIDAKANVPFQIVHVSNLTKPEDRWEVHGEYAEETVQKIISKDQYHRVVLDYYLKGTVNGASNFGKLTMVFGPGITHAESLSAYLNNNIDQYMNDAQRQIYAEALRAYERAVEQHFKDKVRAINFLRKYPFTFADSVHSGNKQINMSNQESNNRLLRNQLGGSLIFCGAVKLMEGYDNRRMELGLLMTPYRRSNTALLQQLGRLLRVDPLNPRKNALAVQFIWDDRQLLLSSSDLLGVMSYGLNQPLDIAIPEHLPGTIEYTISTTMIMSGSVSKGKKRLRELNQVQKSNKKPRTERTKDASPKEILMEKLLDLFIRIQEKSKLLFKFNVTYPLSHESTEMLPSSSSIQSTLTHSTKSSTTTRMDVEEASEEDTETEIIGETNNAIAQLERLLKPQAIPQGLPKKGISGTQKNQEDKAQKDLKDIRKLLTRAKRILKKGEQFFTNSQMHQDNSDFSSLREEWTAIASEISPLIGDYDKVLQETDPLFSRITEASQLFPTEGLQSLFDRQTMRKFFREKLWQEYHNEQIAKGIKIDKAMADGYFSKLFIAIMKRVIHDDNAPIMLEKDTKTGDKYLLEIYHDLPLIKKHLLSLYEHYHITAPIIDSDDDVAITKVMPKSQPILPALPKSPPQPKVWAFHTPKVVEKPVVPQNLLAPPTDTRPLGHAIGTENCQQKLAEVITWHQKTSTIINGRRILSSDPMAYALLEPCIPDFDERQQNINFHSLLRLMQYIDLIIELGLPCPPFKDHKRLEHLLKHIVWEIRPFHVTCSFQSLPILNEARVEFLLQGIGATLQELSTKAYAAILLARAQFNLNSHIIEIPILKTSLMKQDFYGMLACELMRSPQDCDCILRLMNDGSAASDLQQGRIEAYNQAGTRLNHFDNFINSVDVTNAASLRLANFAFVRAEKVRISSEYLSVLVNSYVELGNTQHFEEFDDLLASVTGRQHGLIGPSTFLEGLNINWPRVYQKLPADMAKKIHYRLAPPSPPQKPTH